VGGPNGVVAMNVAKWIVRCARVDLGGVIFVEKR
jgi:hypothetical protein